MQCCCVCISVALLCVKQKGLSWLHGFDTSPCPTDGWCVVLLFVLQV